MMYRISRRALVTGAIAVLPLVFGASQAFGQAQTSDQQNAPNVFLDNHRPLIQKKGRPPVARTVSGKVVDAGGQPVAGALVTLTNEKSKEKTTAITKNDGRYRFEDVSFTEDYEIQARYKGSASEPRKLSQYDRTANVVRILQIGEGADASAAPATEAKKESPKK